MHNGYQDVQEIKSRTSHLMYYSKVQQVCAKDSTGLIRQYFYQVQTEEINKNSMEIARLKDPKMSIAYK
jgi:hypothetical protein